jgi:hypothetical protein
LQKVNRPARDTESLFALLPQRPVLDGTSLFDGELAVSLSFPAAREVVFGTSPNAPGFSLFSFDFCCSCVRTWPLEGNAQRQKCWCETLCVKKQAGNITKLIPE